MGRDEVKLGELFERVLELGRDEYQRNVAGGLKNPSASGREVKKPVEWKGLALLSGHRDRVKGIVRFSER